MRCPVCGYNLKKNHYCPYCKVTDDQIKTASNIEAKKCLKTGEKDKIVMSSTLPNDINRTRLLLVSIALGLFGGHNFYVGRYKRGLYMTITFCVCAIIFGIYQGWFEGNNVFYLFVQLSALVEAMSIVMWFSDVIKIFCKTFPVPVVLGEKVEPNVVNKKNKQKD